MAGPVPEALQKPNDEYGILEEDNTGVVFDDADLNWNPISQPVESPPPIAHVFNGDLSDIPEGSMAILPSDFEEEFAGDSSVLTGIVSAKLGMTGYAAMVVCELGVPMARNTTPGCWMTAML